MEYLWLVLVGLLAGVSGGLLGIGGSTVMIPGMILLFGPGGQHLYQAAAMVVNFFVVAPAAMRHYLLGATLRPLARLLAPSAVVGAVLGVYLSELSVFRGRGQGWLQIAFSMFLFYAIAYNIFRLRSGQRFPRMTEQDSAKLSSAVAIFGVGLPAGLAGGLLGVGGGLIAVPAQQVLLHVPLANAIANSSSTILWSSVAGAILKARFLSGHGYTYVDSLKLAACLIPSAMVGSWIAAEKVHKWPVGVVRTFFVVLMLYCGSMVFLKGWQQINAP